MKATSNAKTEFAMRREPDGNIHCQWTDIFGQVGGIALVINPRYLLATMESSHHEAYKHRHVARALQSYKSMSEMMIKNSLVKIKETPPYSPDLEAPVLLNSLTRASLDIKTGLYKYTVPLPSAVSMDTANVAAISESFNASAGVIGVGVDQGKEAVFKSRMKSEGAAASMLDIEILNDGNGVPQVKLHGDAKAVADRKGVTIADSDQRVGDGKRARFVAHVGVELTEAEAMVLPWTPSLRADVFFFFSRRVIFYACKNHRINKGGVIQSNEVAWQCTIENS
ncbi:hypothetical protein K438DRAFT_2054784 [Mycena galopus ATCC 62051]|nr:hypothetical protein K438DRAFT_2054784 [Mycena galopus ATCC 62051]